MVETMALRALHGSVREDLDTVAAEIKAAIEHGDFPAETRSLFEALRKRVGDPQPAGEPATPQTSTAWYSASKPCGPRRLSKGARNRRRWQRPRKSPNCSTATG